MLNYMMYGSEECGIVTCYTRHGLYFMDWIDIMSFSLCVPLLRHMAINKTAPFVRQRILKDEVLISSATIKSVNTLRTGDADLRFYVTTL